MLFQNLNYEGYLGQVGGGVIWITSEAIGPQCTTSGMQPFFPDCGNSNRKYESTSTCFKLLNTETNENATDLEIRDLVKDDAFILTQTPSVGYAWTEVDVDDPAYNEICGSINNDRQSESSFMGIFTAESGQLKKIANNTEDWILETGLGVPGPNDQFKCECLGTSVAAWVLPNSGDLDS